MTERVRHRIHAEMTLARYRELERQGEPGTTRLSLRAYRETEQAAWTAYRALPPWSRWFGPGLF